MNKKLYPLYKIGFFIILGIIFGNLTKAYVFSTSYVIGDSMLPNFKENDIVGISKIAKPHRGDIVIVEVNDKVLIKRCIGMPGDTVQITQGVVYINNMSYQEDYIKDNNHNYSSGLLENPVTLGSDEYLILGDNRVISLDSRTFGSVKRNQIIGVVTCSISG